MTIEREIINQRIRELVPLAGIGGSREAQEELDRLICIDAEFAQEEQKEDESGWITIYRAGWSEARTRAAIERGNAMIAATMLKGAEGEG